jgi:hypothetical protein
MRTGLIMSVIAHVLLLGLVLLATPTPLATVPARTIAVDIVSPEEVARGSAADSSQSAGQPQPAPQPERDSGAPSSQAQGAPHPQANSQASSSQTPSIDPAGAASTAASPVYWSLLNLSAAALSEGFDAPAVTRAKLSAEEIAAFRAQLQRCWTKRLGVDGGKLQVVIRVNMNRGGALIAEPILVEASVSPNGPALVESAKRALTQCQPYSFLPAEKFDEWRTLDLRFTARGLAGG